MLLCSLRNILSCGVRTAHIIRENVHSEYLTKFAPEEAAIYRYIDLQCMPTKFLCEAASYIATTNLEIRLDSPDGTCIGVCEITHSGGWQNWKEFQCDITPITGIHALYLVAKETGTGVRLCDLNWFCFK